MKLILKRIYRGSKYTIGKLYIDDKYFCDTLEDVDRGLKQSDSMTSIQSRKIYGETAIPTGTYNITIDITSPKFSKKPFYMESCNGKLPRLINVPGFEGILIHVGDGPKGADLTQGCILVGNNSSKGQLSNGKVVFKNLYSKLEQARGNITITIE